MDNIPPETKVPRNQVQDVKKIDIKQLMILAEKAGQVIREAEKREQKNELRTSQR